MSTRFCSIAQTLLDRDGPRRAPPPPPLTPEQRSPGARRLNGRYRKSSKFKTRAAARKTRRRNFFSSLRERRRQRRQQKRAPDSTVRARRTARSTPPLRAPPPPQHLNCLVESRYCPPVHARAHASIGQVRLKLSSFYLFIIPSLNHAHVYYSLSSLCDLAKVRAAWAGGRAGIRMRDADGAGREFEGGLGGPACARMHHHGQRAFPVHVGAGFTGEQLLRYAFPGLSQSWMASRAHNGRNGTRVAARFVGLSTDGYSGRAPSSCTHSSDGAPRV